MNQECALHANTSKENSLAKTRDMYTGRDGPDSFSKKLQTARCDEHHSMPLYELQIAAKLRFITETAPHWLGLN